MALQAYLTDAVPDDQRFKFWQSATSKAFLPLEAEQIEDAPFSGQIHVSKFGDIGVASVAADSQVVRRSRRLIQQTEQSSMIFICQVSGQSLIRQDLKNVHLDEGDITFVDSDRPYELRFEESFSQAVLQVPKQVFLDRSRWVVEMPPMRIGGENPLAQLVQVNLKALLDISKDLPVETHRQVSNAILDMLTMALGNELDTVPKENSHSKVMHIQRAKHYIMQNLKEESLCPEEVANACGVSARYLRALFAEEQQSVSSWIRTQRLESARIELERIGNRSASISQIAYRWGFSDYSHFCRLFKASYGLSPRAWRNKLN